MQEVLEKQKVSLDIEDIRQLVRADIQAVDRLILERLRSDVALINELGRYIINSGGKRLRPLLVLLASRACGYQGHDHIELAAVIEFIHTATLLHDDVVDESDLRRGRQTRQKSKLKAVPGIRCWILRQVSCRWRCISGGIG